MGSVLHIKSLYSHQESILVQIKSGIYVFSLFQFALTLGYFAGGLWFLNKAMWVMVIAPTVALASLMG